MDTVRVGADTAVVGEDRVVTGVDVVALGFDVVVIGADTVVVGTLPEASPGLAGWVLTTPDGMPGPVPPVHAQLRCACPQAAW